MSTFSTFYLSKAQKFEVTTAYDPDRDEVKVMIKTVFDNVTLGVSTAQAKDLTAALQNEITPKEAKGGRPKDDVPF